MDTSKKSVVSMLTSTDKITLFTMTGEVVALSNDGNYNLPKIVEYLTPKLTGMSAVEIDLSDFTLIGQALQSLEVESEGIVVVQVINGKEVQGIFYPAKTSVVVTVGKNKVEIPDVENLSGHMQRAAEEKSPSVTNFFKRLAPVIQARKHSGEDLMKFIQRSEMPLTNDGRIIAYKRVNQHAPDLYKDCHTGKVMQRIGSRVTMPVNLVDPSRHNSCSTGLHVCNLGYLRGFQGSNTLIVLVNPEDFIAVPHGETTKARVCSYDVVGVMNSQGHAITNTGKSVSDNQSFEQMISAIVSGQIVQPFELVTVTAGGKTEITPITGTKAPAKASSAKKANGKPLDEVKTTEVDLVKLAKETKIEAEGLTIPAEVAKAFKMLVDGNSKTHVAGMFNTSTRSIGRWIEKYGDPVELAKAEAARKAAEAVATPEPLVLTKDLQVGPTIAEQVRALYSAWATDSSVQNLTALKEFKKKKKKSWFDLGLNDLEIGYIQAEG